MLYIFGGLPATGKSSLSIYLAKQLKAVHIRVDTIEQALKSSSTAFSGPEGYCISYEIAKDNLRNGLSVVADSVNPLEITRSAWRAVAESSKVPFLEIEVICSDQNEHRQRIEKRSPDIADLKLPTWQEVLDRNYETWGTDRKVIDTAGKSLSQSYKDIDSIVGAKQAV